MAKMISFIILHYMVIEETLKCIDSIKQMEMQDKIKIVVVDNASPNHTGEELQKIYAQDSQVYIILNKDNVGFSKGNNIGCEFAKEKWNPLFYVVTNNDILFLQKDFYQRLLAEYEKKEFDVLGMDIFCPNKGVHQSPLAQYIPTKRAVKRTIFFNKIMLRFFWGLYPIIKSYYKKLDRGYQNAEKYNQFQENVCIMGACLVLTSKYIKNRKKAFYPETNFYYEEFLISLWNKENGGRIVYQPSIKVIHKEGAATKQISADYKKKIKFRIKNIISSAQIFLKELESISEIEG